MLIIEAMPIELLTDCTDRQPGIAFPLATSAFAAGFSRVESQSPDHWSFWRLRHALLLTTYEVVIMLK